MWSRLREQLVGFKGRLTNEFARNPLGTWFILLAIVFLMIIIIRTMLFKNLGFEDKRLWDWLDLLIVPVALAFLVWYFDRKERVSDRIAASERVKHEHELTDKRAEIDRQISDNRNNQQTLESCLEYISEQLLDAHRSFRSVSFRTTIICARILETLDSLATDRRRRDQVIRFLHEMELLRAASPLGKPLFCKAALMNLVLPDADLRKVAFDSSDLSFADLSGADLSNASFSEANLQKVNFTGAKLEGARLDRTNLENVIFKDANLTEVNLNNVDQSDVDFSGLNLSKAIMVGARLKWSKFPNADLSGADLSGTNLENADFRFAKLEGACLNKAVLTGADLRSANLDGAEMNYIILKGAKIDPATTRILQKWLNICEIQGSQAVMDSGSMPDDLMEADGGGSSLFHLLDDKPSEKKQERVQRYTGVDLSFADLSDVDLGGFDLTKTNFKGSLLSRANLSGAILINSNLEDCDLTQTIVTTEQLALAVNVPGNASDVIAPTLT